MAFEYFMSLFHADHNPLLLNRLALSLDFRPSPAPPDLTKRPTPSHAPPPHGPPPPCAFSAPSSGGLGATHHRFEGAEVPRDVPRCCGATGGRIQKPRSGSRTEEDQGRKQLTVSYCFYQFGKRTPPSISPPHTPPSMPSTLSFWWCRFPRPPCPGARTRPRDDSAKALVGEVHLAHAASAKPKTSGARAPEVPVPVRERGTSWNNKGRKASASAFGAVGVGKMVPGALGFGFGVAGSFGFGGENEGKRPVKWTGDSHDRQWASRMKWALLQANKHDEIPQANSLPLAL